jgi:hypothetical protein
MAEYNVYFYPSTKGAGSRVNGWEVVRGFLANSLQRPQEKPGLFVFDNCRHTIRTVPVCQRDTRKTEDVDTDGEDHIADVIRYELTTQEHTVRQDPLAA